MSSDFAIKVNSLGKCYQIYEKPRDRLMQMLIRNGRKLYREFWALRDVSFSIGHGESVGIIGRNGSGKSTLLQLICGTLSPTTGSVETHGRIAALLELGSGFNPEFTGRENVYLNGAVLGFSKEKMDEIFDSIAKFADIGGHLNQPVKTYSSGMLVRLAFAVQIHLEPDVLIVDEALSVGDQFFQTKCFAAIRSMMDDGTTVFFVSHSASTVKALCPRALLLDKGRLIIDDRASQVLDRYFVLGLSGESTARADQKESVGPQDNLNKRLVTHLQPPFEKRVSHRLGTGQARYVECLIYAGNIETTVVETGAIVRICAALDVIEDCPFEGEVGLVVSTIEGIELFAINSFFNGNQIPSMKAGERCLLEFEFTCPLSTGARYRVDLGYRMPVQGEYVDKVFSAAGFSVINQGERIVPLLFDVPAKISLSYLA